MLPARPFAVLILAGLVGVVHAQEPARPSDKPPTFSTEAEMVVVDVVVTSKHGGPLPGLRGEDFEVSEDGAPQQVASFEAVDVNVSLAEDEPVQARPKVSLNTGLQAMNSRSFVLVFDQDHLSPIGAGRAKAAIGQFLRFGPREGDTVMIVGTGGRSWWVTRAGEAKAELSTLLRGLQGRYTGHDTPDRITDWEAMRIWEDRDPIVQEQVRRRMESYATGRQRMAEGFPVRGTDRLTDSAGKELVSSDEILNRAQEAYQMSIVRNRTTLTSLARVLDSMAAVRGRKTVVLFSEGFIRDTRLEAYDTVIRAGQRANVALYFVDVRGLEAMPVSATAQFGSQLPASDVAEQMTQGLVSAAGADELATSTGGFSIKNTNDLERGLRRIAQEARHYYLLGYTSTNPKRDGRWRRISVKLKGVEAEVRARRGYYAPGGDKGRADRAAGTWRPGLQQALDSPYEFQAIPLRLTHHVFGEAAPGKARALMTAEVDIRSLAFAQEKGRSVDTLECLLVVVHREGGDFERHDQKLELQLPPDVRASLEQKWLPVNKEFELGPGGYQARLVVRDTRNGTIGSVRHEFDVPDLRSWRTSTPVLSDTLEPKVEGAPLRPVVPARRAFPSGATLYFQFEVYGSANDPASGLPRVSSGFALRAADGTVVSQGQPAPIRPTPEGRLARLGGVPLKGMPPGRYELVLSLRDDVSGRSMDVREPFSIEPEPAARASSTP
jgi:VWFA-related protein